MAKPATPESVAAEAKSLVTTLPAPPVIRSDDDLAAINLFLREIRGRAQKIEALRVSVTKPLDAAKAAAQALFKPSLEELAQLEREVKQSILTYQNLREQQRQAALREQQAAMEAAEKAIRDDLALSGLAGGEEEEADLTTVFEAAINYPVPAKVSLPGVSTRTTYVAEVTDLAAFVTHCASTGLLHYLEPNMKLLNQLAVGLKREGQIFPGVTSVAKQTVAVR